MIKRAFVVILSALLLVGCGSAETPTVTSAPENPTQTEAPAEVDDNDKKDDSAAETPTVNEDSSEEKPAEEVHDVAVNTISEETKEKAKSFPKVNGKLPKWRGVNVVDKAEFAWSWVAASPSYPEDVEDTSNTVYKEAEAIEISEAGYNFVRICLDSRYFFTDESKVTLENVGSKFYGSIDTANLTQYENLDQMIEWCINRDIHVCLDCHSTYGGLMIGGDEETSRKKLFTPGSKAQKMFIEHWKRLAVRYADVDTKALSFNLYNEPPAFATSKEGVYVKLLNKAIDEIQKVTDDRLIFVDMMQYGTQGMKKIKELHANNLVACFHFYGPDVADTEVKDIDLQACMSDISSRLPSYNSYAKKNKVRWMLQEYGCNCNIKESKREKYCKAIIKYCKSKGVPYALWAFNDNAFNVATWANGTDKFIPPGAKYVETSQGHRINKKMAEITSK